MSILWCGGEEIDFYEGSVYDIDTSTGNRRTAYSRCAIRMWNTAVVKSRPIDTPVSSAWLSCWFVKGTYFNTQAPSFCLGNSSSGSLIGVGAYNFDNSFALLKDDDIIASISLVGNPTVTVSDNPQKLDIQVSNYGSNGTVNVWKNGTLILTYTGDIALNGDTTLDQVVIKSYSSTWFSCSEIIFADEDTRSMSLKTLVPNAAGDTNEWDGAYTDIDEIVLNEIDAIYTTVGDEVQTFGLSDLPAGTFVVKAVKTAYRAIDSAGDFSLQPGIKTNSAVNLESTVTLEYGFTNQHVLYTVNPETTNQWTIAEVDALQLAFKSIDLGA